MWALSTSTPMSSTLCCRLVASRHQSLIKSNGQRIVNSNRNYNKTAILRQEKNTTTITTNTSNGRTVVKETTTTTATVKPSPNTASTTTSSSTGSSWKDIPKDYPFAFQLAIATAKTAAADLVVQTVAEGKSLSQVDWRRNGIFIVFGSVYLGGFQYWIMVNKYRQWFPTMDRFGKLSMAEKLRDKAGILDAAKMVVFDITIHLPLMYFPSYYTVKEFVSGNSYNPIDWAKEGLTKYRKNMREDLTAMIKLWGPSDCIQFALPTHIRMPFRHMVSFFWTAYVSFTRGKIEPQTHSALVDAAEAG